MKQGLKKQQLTRLPLPVVTLENARSLRNKADKLQGNICCQKDFKSCCVIALTESWLTVNDRDADFCMDGFGAPLRLNRHMENTGKMQGGGVCLYINKQ